MDHSSGSAIVPALAPESRGCISLSLCRWLRQLRCSSAWWWWWWWCCWWWWWWWWESCFKHPGINPIGCHQVGSRANKKPPCCRRCKSSPNTLLATPPQAPAPPLAAASKTKKKDGGRHGEARDKQHSIISHAVPAVWRTPAHKNG